MGAHLINGQFQSDKYPTCPPGKVPLSVNDSTAQDLLWMYAQRRRGVDAEFADDLETALRAAGYTPNPQHALTEAEASLVILAIGVALEPERRLPPEARAACDALYARLVAESMGRRGPIWPALAPAHVAAVIAAIDCALDPDGPHRADQELADRWKLIRQWLRMVAS